MRPLVNYYGAKWMSAEWIISHFPEHEIFVEVFGGSAAVLMKKPRSKREIANDMDDEIVNLYQVVRDHGSRLKELCALTPHSRTEYERAREYTTDPLERARRTIVKTYFGIGDSLYQKNGFRMSKESNTCHAKTWKTWWQTLDETIARFQGVIVECLDFETLLEKYDTPTTLFYLDPPYVLETRDQKHKYKHDFTNADHDRLLSSICKLKGFAILSGYNHELYNNFSWKRVEKEATTNGKGTNTESLWLCPRTATSEKQISFQL